MSRQSGTCQYSGELRDCYTQLERRPQPWVTYNSKLKCPELSPWLQKLNILKKNSTGRQPTAKVPKNYSYLRKNRFLNKYKYFQPLTPHFRYYDETECYIEEYRLYKIPSEWKRQMELEREYNYLTALSLDMAMSCSSSNTSSSPKPKNRIPKYKDYRAKVREDVDTAYLNNAKVTTEPSYTEYSSIASRKRVAIKIPKCETKNRRTFFPVILSRYSGMES